MIRSCPDPQELAVWLDREAGERRAEQIRGHVAGCSVCTREVAALERLLAELRVPAAATASPAQVRAVMARLDAPAPRAPVSIAGLAVAAAAAAVLAIAVWPSPDGAGFQARGGIAAHEAGSALDRAVGTTLYTLRHGGDGPRAIALATGDAVHRDTAFVLAARNLERSRPLWLVSFAVDAAGDIHWLYPGYASADDDPIAPLLPPSEREAMRPDSVVLDRPALGALRVVVMISPRPLHVSAIEHRPSAELALPALQQRWPGAAITELPLQVVP